VIAIALLHYFIDLVKINVEHTNNKIPVFLIGQALYLCAIVFVAHTYHPLSLNWLSHNIELIWLTVLVITLNTQVASVLKKVFLSKWKIASEHNNAYNAGKYIGMLERLFMVCFILTLHFEGIGFLLAAKSVFRFGDLN
jgi:hypothetical protein